MALSRSTLPNAITVVRIVLAPVIFMLFFVPTLTARLLAFALFLIAAFSDLCDGYLARKYGWVSDFGKLFDPIADKLLMVATLVPFYLLSQRPSPTTQFPVIGAFPLWVLLVILGREALVTVIRSLAARRGVVIAAGREGKLKTVFQNIFSGAAILWFALLTAGLDRGWGGEFWYAWRVMHGSALLALLVIALVMTVYSLAVYLWEWRRLAGAT